MVVKKPELPRWLYRRRDFRPVIDYQHGGVPLFVFPFNVVSHPDGVLYTLFPLIIDNAGLGWTALHAP